MRSSFPQPFLIDGFKFDLRLYVLVTSIVPLRVFVYKDGLARFTTQLYREPTAANVGNVFLHLTNYAIQKHSEQFIRGDEEAGTKRRVTTVNCWLIEHGYDVEKVIDTGLWDYWEITKLNYFYQIIDKFNYPI